MILLLGSSGYVGTAFKRFFEREGIEYITHQVRYPIDPKHFAEVIKDNNIERVINCSGYVGIPNVDACEDSKEDCLFANGLLPRQIADVCSLQSINVPHIFVSSGCIFFDEACESGLEPSMEFTYRNIPNFTFDQKYRSWYSGTKYLGEKLLKPFSKTHVCRLRIPFNGEINPRNFLYKAINYPKLVKVTNSFSNLEEFVESCYKISTFALSESLAVGARFYNLTQPGYLTTNDIVDMLVNHGLVDGKDYFKNYSEFLSSVRSPRSNCVLKSCSDRVDTPFNMTKIKESMNQSIIDYKNNLLK